MKLPKRRAETAPFGKSSGSIQLKAVSAVKRVFLVEAVMNLGGNGN